MLKDIATLEPKGNIEGGLNEDVATPLQGSIIPDNLSHGWYSVKIGTKWFAFQVLLKSPETSRDLVFDDFAFKAPNVPWGNSINDPKLSSTYSAKSLVALFQKLVAPEKIPVNITVISKSYKPGDTKAGGTFVSLPLTTIKPDGTALKPTDGSGNPLGPSIIEGTDAHPLTHSYKIAYDKERGGSGGRWVYDKFGGFGGADINKGKPILLQDDPSSFGLWNPPPHKVMSGSVPTQLYDLTSGTPDVVLNPTVGVKLIEDLRSGNKAYTKGFIYSDLDQAHDSDGNPKVRGNLWGFRFLYNPSSLSIANAVNPAIDFGNTADVGNMLIGSETMSFSIYLNRMMDVHVLKNISVGSAGPGKANLADQNTFAHQYGGRTLTAIDAEQLRYRGTEYDLEFLYRVINGDPEKGPAMRYATSDTGFLVGSAVWVRFNDNVRYKGIINNISVVHAMFSLDMVPIVSEVSISLMRIPTPYYGTDAQISKKLNKKYKTTPNQKGSRGQQILPYVQYLRGTVPSTTK
jgi:hypothetical protein